MFCSQLPCLYIESILVLSVVTREVIIFVLNVERLIHDVGLGGSHPC